MSRRCFEGASKVSPRCFSTDKFSFHVSRFFLLFLFPHLQRTIPLETFRPVDALLDSNGMKRNEKNLRPTIARFSSSKANIIFTAFTTRFMITRYETRGRNEKMRDNFQRKGFFFYTETPYFFYLSRGSRGGEERVSSRHDSFSWIVHERRK